MKRPLRILQLTEAFEGGIFTSLTRLATVLAERGNEVHLAYSRRPQTPADVAAQVPSNVVLHEVAMRRAIDPRADWQGFLAVRRLLRGVQPDIVHLHSSKAGVLGRAAARASGLAAHTFYSPRGLSFLQEDHSAFARSTFRAIEWMSARLGGTVVACSASERALIDRHLRPRHVALVENAVDVEAVPMRTARGDDSIVIGIVGRITYARNAQLFAALARRFADPRVQFLWIGGGDAAERMALEQAGVVVTGWMSRQEALAAMARLDIYLHPSRWEGMPVALIESQVAGLPAVATDVVGNRDVVVPGVTGYLGHDLETLAAPLRALIDDRALRERMGARAREEALPRFNLKRLGDDLERLYAAAL